MIDIPCPPVRAGSQVDGLNTMLLVSGLAEGDDQSCSWADQAERLGH